MDRDRRPPSGEGSGLTDRPRERFSLAELTEAANVSVRTVRYYIAEGLLPKPTGSGPKAFYTRGHLDRLRLISAMRADYLPLKEIRRRLDEMSDAEIRREAERIGEGAEEAAPAASPPPSPSSARGYIDMVRRGRAPDELRLGERRRVGRQQESEEVDELPRLSRSLPPVPLGDPETSWDASAVDAFDGLSAKNLWGPEEEDAGTLFFVAESPAMTASDLGSEAVPLPTPRFAPEETVWHRLPIGPDAELLVSDRLMRQRRNAIRMVLDWAWKLLR